MSGVDYSKALQPQLELDKERRAQAEQLFANDILMDLAIERQIYPNIVPIRISNRSTGIGYYIAPNFLMTNAHVLPTYEDIQHSSIVTRYCEVEKSFHRPDKRGAPDIVLIKIKDPSQLASGLQTNFSGDVSLDKSLLFFINYNFEDERLEFAPIELVSEPEELPVKYKCLDDSIPQPGCSGAPVVEARVILGREPFWQFRLVGMVYARCNSIDPNEKLLCAIPVNFDLQQIYQIETLHEDVARLSQQALAAGLVTDATQSESLSAESKKVSGQANAKFIAYIEGETILNIELPQGLEKLIGSQIIDIEDSLLLEKNQKKYKRINFKDSASAEDLKKDLDSLFELILSSGRVTLKKGDMFFSSKFFRIDVCESSKIMWKIDLQDNTGKGVKIDGKSASSVFAICRVPKNSEPILGTDLVNLLRKSMEIKKAIDHASLQTEVTAKPKKKF